MPPRLSHTKSRTGCYRCKARKVKCDEAHPRCQNCARHNVECRYPKHTHATSKQSPATELSVEACLTADERRHLEQQLLHYFSSSIVWTLGSSQNSTGREVWSYTAVELGFKHAFLHNSILAFAALYLLKTTPESRRFFAPLDEHESASRAVNRDIKLDCPVPLSTIHELYLDLALRQQREAATKLTAESANAFWLSTMLHWYQAAPHFSHDLVDDGYAPPVNWLRMAQANRTFAQLSRELMPDKHLIWQVTGEIGPDFDDHEALYGIQNCAPFVDLLDWIAHPEPHPLSAETRRTYEVFLAYVGSIYKGLQEGEHHRRNFRRLLCLGIFCPAEVIDLLEERRPRALAILALYFAMTYSQNDHWIWRGLADQQINGIASIMPSDWSWSMDRPRALLEELKSKSVALS